MQGQVAATELSDRITTTASIIKHCQNNAEVNAVGLCASKCISYIRSMCDIRIKILICRLFDDMK